MGSTAQWQRRPLHSPHRLIGAVKVSYTVDSTGPNERNLPLDGAGPMVVGPNKISTSLSNTVLKSSKINLLIRAAFSK